MTQPIKKPQKPSDNDCCEGGCDPCVWDIYYEDLSQFRKIQRASRQKNNTMPES